MNFRVISLARIGCASRARDLGAILHRAKEQDLDGPLLNAVLPSNQREIISCSWSL